jgi:hypothetical protein
MRFARLQCDDERHPAGLTELAGQDLDFLQLDYLRPRVIAADGSAPIELPGCAYGFSDVARELVKGLFLEPDFRIITSAGWSDAYGCVERTAQVLVDGGCGDLPMAAVRGSNLLPIIDLLESEGVKLTNAESGAAWRELKQPVLAADLQIGAGPIVTALAEKARIIVAGCYDPAGPALASAVTRFGWKWHDLDHLAAAAMASHAAAWRHWQPDAASSNSRPWAPAIVELNDSGQFNVAGVAGGGEAASALQRWLSPERGAQEAIAPSEVQVDWVSRSCAPVGTQTIEVSGARGAAADSHWLLEVLYQAGFTVETLIEFQPKVDPQFKAHLADAARWYLKPKGDAAGVLTVQPLKTEGASGVSWLHLAYQSKSRKACRYIAEQVNRLLAGQQDYVRLAPGPPRVQAHCGVWPVRVPRDAVDIAVETRPAREWI